MLSNNSDISTEEIESKKVAKGYSWTTVFAWLYLHTIGKISPESWNEWANYTLSSDVDLKEEREGKTNEVENEQAKEYSWKTVSAWLYLHTIGKVLPEEWNKWADDVLSTDVDLIEERGTQTGGVEIEDNEQTVNLRQENEDLKVKNWELQCELSELRKEFAKLHGAKEEVKQKLVRAEEEKGVLGGQVEQISQQHVQELEGRGERIIQLEVEFRKVSSEVEEYKNSFITFQEYKTEMEKTLKDSLRRVQDVMKENLDLEKDNLDLKQQLEKENAHLERIEQQHTQELQKKGEEATQLTSELEKKDQNIERIRSECNKLQEELRAMQQPTASQQELNQSKYVKEIAELKGELGEEKTRKLQIETKLSESDEKIVQLEAEIQNMRSKVTQYENMRKNYESMEGNFDNQAREWQDRIKTVQDTLMKENESLTQQLAKALEDFGTKKELQGNQSKNNSETYGKLKNRCAELERENKPLRKLVTPTEQLARTIQQQYRYGLRTSASQESKLGCRGTSPSTSMQSADDATSLTSAGSEKHRPFPNVTHHTVDEYYFHKSSPGHVLYDEGIGANKKSFTKAAYESAKTVAGLLSAGGIQERIEEVPRLPSPSLNTASVQRTWSTKGQGR